MKKLILICVLLSGCASLPAGVQMSDDERKACEAETCSVWTVQELRKLITKALQQGYAAGRKSL